MMNDSPAIVDQIVQAARADADAGRFTSAAEGYAVAADHEEEHGRIRSAWLYRVAMRRLLVAAWARQHFPRVTWHSVRPVRQRGVSLKTMRRGAGEGRLFHVVVGYGVGVEARVDKSGRVYEVRRDRNGRLREVQGACPRREQKGFG